MEINEKTFDHLLQNLRSARPELKNAGKLTDSIMQKIQDNSRRRKPAVLILVRTLSTSAAILLLGLFLFQQNESVSITYYKPSNNYNYKISIDSICMQNQHHHISNTNLLAIYICHLQQNSIKNKLYKSFDQQLNN